MDIANYYVTTLTNAAGNLGPIVIFCLVGYFLFIKLPFSLMVKVNKDQKLKSAEEPKKESPSLNMKELQDKIRKEENNYQEKLNQAREEKEKKQREYQQKQKENQKEKEPPKRTARKLTLAEELFELEADQSFSKEELKKRYHDLIRQNHPDKVASLGADFKKLAEKKTKDINSAYEQLKKKAS